MLKKLVVSGITNQLKNRLKNWLKSVKKLVVSGLTNLPQKLFGGGSNLFGSVVWTNFLHFDFF